MGDLKRNGIVESHPNVTKGATFGWGTRPEAIQRIPAALDAI